MPRPIAVSTWSLHQHLGPVRSTELDEHGEHEFTVRHQFPEDIPLLDFARFVKDKYGLRHVELCQMHFPSSGKEYLDKLRGRLAELGCDVVNVPIDVGNISNLDGVARQRDIANIRHWLEAAAYIGSPCVRVNAGHQPEGQENLDITIASFKELVASARKLGLKVLLENHWGVSTKPENVLRLLDGVASDSFRLCPDTGNFQDVDRFQALADLLPHAAVVHVKSYEFDQVGNEVRYDLRRALDLIADKTPASVPVSVEFEGPGDQIEGVASTVSLLKSYFG